MKFKYVFIALSLTLGIFLAIFFYYRFDPGLLTRLSFYLNLANPYVRIVKVQEGLRNEQVADIVGDKLAWSEAEKAEFLNSVSVEGHIFPKTYLLDQDADPAAVTETMTDEFAKEMGKVKKPASMQIINQDTAIKIASIIQREAAGKQDMNLISGIIWNRLFNGMKLQIDATLQYAKGNEEDGWWTKVDSADKTIESAYNTYLYQGLPPGPISNPGLAAISAAFNPAKTDCLFYLHDKRHKIHCAKTYEEHLVNIKRYLQ
ncbi:MAG: endolytic transglycosylase MltG [bacterium]